ncbi:CAR family subclass B3 metallo-beta-lactamase [Dickeya lacustris]|uniref:CAR family subclass B3 metallo-beta-lactamase n=1 Tax=Dickeya lacustris TaxID=2259638 RepID=A0ABY8G8Y8_9GAMM|nr:CAR family subclass B3 metallo-beta-lactamase [Dickeya lacustris]WFN56349.1 CAR family subclass B3 metallo-beta-lactamase [Dickeya lacustris]
MLKKYLVPSLSTLLLSLPVSTLAQTPSSPEPKGASSSLSGCPSDAINAQFAEFGRTGRLPPALGQWLNNRQEQQIAPYKVFDNVYFVGICWVSAWLIKTSEGPVLIDTLHEPYVDQLLANIRQIGVDPAEIKLVLMTHGHFDHVGGAYKIKALSKARFVMTQAGWDEAQKDASQSQHSARPWKMLEHADIVAQDGQAFTVGDTTFYAYATPGHTWGTTSYAFDVKDGANTYRALTVGGMGLNAIENARQVDAYIASIDRLKRLVSDPAHPISVHLTAHPFNTGLTEKRAQLASHHSGETHPLVNQADLLKQLDDARAQAEQRLHLEQQKAPVTQ